MKKVHGPIGYTILEVLVAVILLAIVLPGLTTFVIGARKAQTTSSRLEQGTTAAQKVLDSLSICPSNIIAASGSSTQTLDGTDYTVSWTNDVFPNSSNPVGHRITLTAQWTVGAKVRQSVLTGVLK